MFHYEFTPCQHVSVVYSTTGNTRRASLFAVVIKVSITFVKNDCEWRNRQEFYAWFIFMWMERSTKASVQNSVRQRVTFCYIFNVRFIERRHSVRDVYVRWIRYCSLSRHDPRCNIHLRAAGEKVKLQRITISSGSIKYSFWGEKIIGFSLEMLPCDSLARPFVFLDGRKWFDRSNHRIWTVILHSIATKVMQLCSWKMNNCLWITFTGTICCNWLFWAFV